MTYEEQIRAAAERLRSSNIKLTWVLLAFTVLPIFYVLFTYLSWTPQKVKQWKHDNGVVCKGLECSTTKQDWQLRWDLDKQIWVPK